jgi:hypothetical protein
MGGADAESGRLIARGPVGTADAIDGNEIGLTRVGRSGKAVPMERQNQFGARQDEEADDELGFDPATPPAPIDIHAFARRAGEIIARAARAFRGRKSER